MKTIISDSAKKPTAALAAMTAKRRNGLKGAVALDAIASSAKRNDLIPVMKLESRMVASLHAPEHNVRKHDVLHHAEIASSIAELGLAAPPIVTADGEIINGVATVGSATALGLKEIPCVVVSDLTPERIKLLRIALNRLGEKGDWDMDELKVVMEELIVAEQQVIVTGFTTPQIDLILMDEPAIDMKANDCPELTNEAPVISRVGDLWNLGSHRVLCADATKPESYVALFGTTPLATAVFADPPYNVKIDGFAVGAGAVKHREFVAASGEMTDKQFTDFLSGFLKASSAHLANGSIMYVCMDWRHDPHLRNAAIMSGLKLQNLVIWSKGTGGLGSLYRSAYEMVFVYKTGKAPITNNVELGKHGRDRTNVWTYPGANRRGSSANSEAANHPTPKPVELVADALLDVTKRGDVIIDPFLGSGTSIIAAQKTGRIAYGLELDPQYVDLVIRRFKKFTGIEAVHAETGMTFGEMAATHHPKEPVEVIPASLPNKKVPI